MPKDQPDASEVVSIVVNDNPVLSFYFDTASKTVCEPPSGDSGCTVAVTNAAYERLKDGTTTFEQEATSENLSISGDVALLRILGKAFRAEQNI